MIFFFYAAAMHLTWLSQVRFQSQRSGHRYLKDLRCEVDLKKTSEVLFFVQKLHVVRGKASVPRGMVSAGFFLKRKTGSTDLLCQ